MNQTDWVFAPKDSVPKARQAVENALRIDETLAEAHTMLAMILLQYDWNWLAAEREFRRAIELDPNYALGRSFLAWHLAAMGRFDESIAEDKRALELDPLSACGERGFRMGSLFCAPIRRSNRTTSQGRRSRAELLGVARVAGSLL